MTHQERDTDLYWQQHERLGESRLDGERTGIWLRLHQEQERFGSHDELVPLRVKTGKRLYVQAQPYILVPEFLLTVDVDLRATGPEPIGQVIDSQWKGMRQHQIGNAQAWLYPDEGLLMIWECYLDPHYRGPEPTGDETLLLVWTGFERQLLRQFPTTERLVTPAWEDIYDREVWQDFLRQRGYQPFEKAAYVREVSRVRLPPSTKGHTDGVRMK